MKYTKYIYITLSSIFFIACENAPQALSKTTEETIKNATTPTGSVGAIITKPLKPVISSGTNNSTAVSFSKSVMPLFADTTLSCTNCHNSTPLQVTGKSKNRFSVTNASNTYVNIISNKLVDTNNPANSRLLQKATNTIIHFGSDKIKVNSTQYNTILNCIKEGVNNN